MPRLEPIPKQPTMPANRCDYLRHYKPQLSFVPSLIGLIRNRADDPSLKKFLTGAKADPSKLLSSYSALTSEKKIDRYGKNYAQLEKYDKTFKDLLQDVSKEYQEKMRLEDLRQKEAVRRKLIEFRKMSLQEIMQKVPADAYELIAMQKYMQFYWKKLSPCCESSATTGSSEGVNGNPPLTPKKILIQNQPHEM